jgi:hypothetical protein
MLLAAFAGMFAFTPRSTESKLPPVRTLRSSGAAATATSSPAASATPALSPALRMIDEFYKGGELQTNRAGKSGVPRWTVESLIALLPDPVESGLGDQFDNYLDAIQRALADSDYALDRFRNPWPLPPPGGESYGGANTQDFGGEDSDSPLSPKFAREPGLMLFRDALKNKLMVVFLVGETPTRGLHKSAFKNALSQALEISLKFPTPPRGDSGAISSAPVVKVMGPSFSGSVVSMKFALSAWLADPKNASQVKIISGSATAVDRHELKKYFSGYGETVEYEATVIPDELVLKKLLQWLNAPQGDGVAVLGEEDTVYARDVARQQSPSNNSNHDHALYLSFPLHIAELQRAMQRAEANSKSGALPVPLLQNPNLPLGSSEAQTRIDVFPLFSNSETNSLELLLDGVMRTVTDRKIKYVIIIATDIEDTIFLAQRIRESCPNVIPIALNGDVLFLHSSVNTYLRGAIVASTYPLYFENQFWTRRDLSNPPRLVQFPSDTAEGVYNATLALLDKTKSMLDYARPFSPASTHPPVWITMVGSDQFWPLATYAVDNDGYMPDAEGTKAASGCVNPTFIFYPAPFLILCALVGIGSLLLWRLCTHTPTEKSRGFDYAIFQLRQVMPVYLQQSFGDAPSIDYLRSRRVILLMFLMVLFGLSTTVACFFFLPLRTNADVRAAVLPFDLQFGGLGPLAFAVVVICLIGAIYFWSDRTAPGRTRNPEFDDVRWREIAPTAVIVLICLLWMGLAPLDTPLDPAGRIFLFFRVIDLDSGATPLVPLLLAYGACLAMIIGAMRRRTFVEARLFDTQFLDFKTGSFAGVAELEARVRDAAQIDSWKSWEWRATVGAVVLAYLVFFRPWESTIDGMMFMLTFFAFSLAAYVGIATALVRLLTIWGATRKLLQRLFWHPSRAGYAKLRDAMAARDAAIDLFSPAPTLTALEAGLTNVRGLVKAASTDNPHGDAAVCELLRKFRESLDKRLNDSEAALNETIQAIAGSDWDKEVNLRRKTESRIRCVSQLVASIFEPLWRSCESIPESKVSVGDGDKPSSIDTAGELYVATRVVDFLRQVMPQLRTLALTSTFAMLLMLFAISSYPFPTRDHLLWFSWGMVMATAASILWMCFSLNRDRVVSLICGTTPGQIDWNATLLAQLLTHGLIPIIVLLGAAYPAELGRLAQWVGSLFGGRG